MKKYRKRSRRKRMLYPKQLERQCSSCGKKLDITLNKDRTYSGGYYFGKFELPVGEGEYVKTGDYLDEDKKEIPVVRWTGKKKEVEYWECESCFEDEASDAASIQDEIREKSGDWNGTKEIRKSRKDSRKSSS